MDEEFVVDDGAVELAVLFDGGMFLVQTYAVEAGMLKLGESRRVVKLTEQQTRELVEWLEEMLP